jgi:hypothetical protein
MAENYLRNEGNDNIFLQNINGCNIHINERTEIEKVLEDASKDVLRKIVKEIDAFSKEIKESNDAAFTEIKRMVEAKIHVSHSKNVSADSNFENIEGDITFGDNNYSYKGHTINIHGGISVEQLKQLIKDEEFKKHYTDFSIKEGSVYKKFLYLDREITDDLISGFVGKKRFFYFQTFNSSQPDWLFDRFVVQLNEELGDRFDFQPYLIELRKTLSFDAVKRKTQAQLNLDKTIDNPQDILSNPKFNEKSIHLFHFSIDVDLQSEELNTLIDNFFDFWFKDEIKEVNYVVFLTIKIREKNNVPFFMKLFGSKKLNNPKATTNKAIFFRDFLPLITQNDINRFFEYNLQNINPKVTVTQEQEIQDMWTALVPEIYHSTTKTQTK